MGSHILLRALLLALASCVSALTPLSAANDDNDCALYLSGPGRTSSYDYTLNLLKGNFGYEGQHTCITYDAVNQAYLEARNRIVVAQPKGDWKAEDFASVGELILDISINLARRYGLTYEEIEKGLPLIDTSRTLVRDVCPPVFSHVECRAGKYRRLDGLCNNLDHPTWGSTMAPFQRLIGPLFADGINAPRIAHTGRDLPLSRVVSRTMHPDEGFHDHAGTVMVIAWGQFMDHDYTLTGTPLDPINRNDPEECCKRPPHLKHPYCNEIRVPDDDYFYRLWGVKCIDFVRAFPSPRPGCRLGSRVPFNTLTGVIDGNTVYGVTDKFSRKLRTGFGGLLRMNPVFKEYGLKDLLPLKLDIPDEGCTRPNKNMYCFEGGEIRVNEQLVLTVMHTLMAREHNRIAEGLAAVNPHWDDETLFQEARRINVAEIQHITYNEFLPILLGKDVMEKFGLMLEKDGYWDGYDPNVNPDVIDAFASAAFRFGHSLLPTAVERWSKAHKFIASKRLSDLIRRPYDLYRAGVLDEYVMGLMNQVAQAMDDSITQEVTNHLFKKIGARFGMDLVSFNMQRGREFGIPGYMEFRKFCGLSGAETFQDLFGSMPNETVRKYETIFEHPIDVDLWSGGVSERPLPGSMLGPTFACVIATQFSYSRRGDRFWFELPNQPSSFTPEQLKEVRKSRLARVICDNTDIIDTVQLYPMVLPDHELNPRVPCRSGIIPSIDFSKWAEPAPFHGGAKPFVTDAYINVTNDTESEDKRKASINVAENTHNNDSNSILQDGVHNVTKELTSVQQQNTMININQTINCTHGHNCTRNETMKNDPMPKETHGSDTVLKYVYKDSKNNALLKSKGHSKNSLKRRKRSASNTKDRESAPLIVNYETSHGPQEGQTFARNTANVIRNADLADFNIETLHENHPNEKNEDKPQNKARNNDNENDFIAKSREDAVSDERENFKEEKEKKTQYREDKSSEEREEYTSSEKIPQSDEKSIESNNEKRTETLKDNRDESHSQENYRDSEPYRQRDDSREKDENLSRESAPHDSEESHENNTTNEKDAYRKTEPNDSGEIFENIKSQKSPYSESRERDEPTSYERGSEHSLQNDDSNDELNKKQEKVSYLTSLKDSNEAREESEESSYPKQESKEHKNSKENIRSSYSKPGRKSSDSNEKEDYKDKILYREVDYTLKHYTESPVSKNNKKVKEFTTANSSEEEETIIAIMKKKNRKPYNKPQKEYKQPDKKILNIKDIDLRNFSYERINVDDNGLVKPVKETNENTNVEPSILPLTTFKPETIKKYNEKFTRSQASKKQPLINQESSDENDQPIDDVEVEVKPVIEINADKDDSQEENSKEALKANLSDDTSLETFLGVKDFSVEKSDKIISTDKKGDKGDVKQQFERIPLNYNHAKKQQEQNKDNTDSSKNNPNIQNDDNKVYQGTLDILTPKDHKYDEHLNIKFDDISIKLPEIKLPDDILAFPASEHRNNKKSKGDKKADNEKFFHYNEDDYNDDNPHEIEKNVRRSDDHDYYDEQHKKNDDYRKEPEEKEENNEEEDLYEKFVRERFGKKGSFEQRSEKLQATGPSYENQRLFKSLRQVLQKADSIDKEAEKSGDPNAGYMWTLEYGQKL